MLDIIQTVGEEAEERDYVKKRTMSELCKTRRHLSFWEFLSRPNFTASDHILCICVFLNLCRLNFCICVLRQMFSISRVCRATVATSLVPAHLDRNNSSRQKLCNIFQKIENLANFANFPRKLEAGWTVVTGRICTSFTDRFCWWICLMDFLICG